jgi:hypothetical protein
MRAERPSKTITENVLETTNNLVVFWRVPATDWEAENSQAQDIVVPEKIASFPF